MKAWKVTVNGKSVISALHSNKFAENDLLYLKYSLYNKTVPNIGRIFVFKDLYNILNWVDNSRINNLTNQLVFFHGEAENIGHPYYISKNINEGCIVYFWEKTKKWKKKCTNDILMTSKCPYGTFSCSSFTPLEKYTYYEAWDKLKRLYNSVIL